VGGLGVMEKLSNSRSIGDALHGKKFGELWNYRVGDIRIIARIENKELVILVVRVVHRKGSYK